MDRDIRKRQSPAGRHWPHCQELERVRTSSSTSEEHRDIPRSKRALAVSKTEAAKDFGGQPHNDRLQHCSQGDKRIPRRPPGSGGW